MPNKEAETKNYCDPWTIHAVPCGLAVGFLIETGGGLFLVDSGSPGQESKVLAKMKSLGRSDLRCIWITHAHYDHYGSAAALRKLTGAKIGVHCIDADYMIQGLSPLGTWRRQGFLFLPALKIAASLRPLPPVKPDFTLQDGDSLERYGLEASVLFTPGHTPGHTCLVSPGGIIFAGDLISSMPRPSLQHLIATDWRQLKQSLARLQSIKPEMVYAGHSRSPIPGKVIMDIR